MTQTLRARVSARQLPSAGRHLVRGGVPCPDIAPERLKNMALRDPRTGLLIPTQVEGYASGPGGEVAMAEVMALWDAPAGGEWTFDLVEGEGELVGAVPPPYLNLLGSNTLSAVALTSDDHRGVRYKSSLLAPTPALTPVGQHVPARDLTWWRNGAIARTLRVAGELRLSPEDSSFDRFMGFVAYLTEVAGENVLIVEMRLHNATAVAPIAGDLYFRDLTLELPEGWEISHLWPEPWAGGVEPSGRGARARRHALIRRRSDGKPHFFKQMARRLFRFAIHRTGNQERARRLLEQTGFAVADPGVVKAADPAGPSTTLWSLQSLWHYFPQGEALPISQLRAGASPAALAARPFGGGKSLVWAALQNGSPLPSWANQGAAGPFHPYSISYGGGTGGEGIYQVDAIELAVTGDRSILHAYMAVQRMNTDRCAIGLYDLDGHVVDHEDFNTGWVLHQPGGFAKGAEGEWTFSKAPQWRRDQVYAAGQQPDYESYLRSFSPYDFQHLVRCTSGSVALAWLDRDPLAWDEVETCGEMSWMWAHEGHGTLSAAFQRAQAWPGKGAAGGRDDGWAWLAVLARHQLVPRTSDYVARRARFASWIAIAKEVVKRAQLPSGFWQAMESGKPFDQLDGSSAVSQSIENGIFAGAVAALARSSGDSSLMDAHLDAAVCLLNFHWSPGTTGAWRIRAVRPVSPALPAYDSRDDVPPTAHLPQFDIDSTQLGAVLALARRTALVRGDDGALEILEKAADALTGYTGKPVDVLKANILSNLEDRAVLLRVLDPLTPVVVSPPPRGGETEPPTGEPPPTRGETDPSRGETNPPRTRDAGERLVVRLLEAFEGARLTANRRAIAAGVRPMSDEEWLELVTRRLATRLVADVDGVAQR
jgi:hypothetical protein